jgi:uncharacterized membrane protein
MHDCSALFILLIWIIVLPDDSYMHFPHKLASCSCKCAIYKSVLNKITILSNIQQVISKVSCKL